MISTILLAAGQSLRMNGENKLLKQINGIPLIKCTVKNILASAVDELIIVLGHEDNLLKNTIGINKKTKFIYNKDFKKGMSSSIKVGLNEISKKSQGFFISLGDMPNINQSIYNKLIKSMSSYNKKLKPIHKKEIIIPTFEGREGNPVLFSKFMKNKIMNLDGDIGAKKIIEQNRAKVLNVPFDNKGIIIDFDTQDHFNAS